MSNYLALHITDTKARMMLAISDAKSLRVRNAIELNAADATELQSQIKETVTKWNCAGVATLYALDRDQCEIRRLPVPDVGKDELPDLVRYQAVQNFSALAPDWALDFIALPGSKTDEGKFVLAGAIAPDRMKQIESLCDAIGCPLQGVILRPCATAALVHDVLPGSRGEGQVVVDHNDGIAELLVMTGPKAVLMRSVRLSSDDPEANAAALVPEVKRTIAAAASSQSGLKVSRVVVCGNDAEDDVFANALRKESGLPVQSLENWSGARIHKSLPDKPIEHAGGFLPLIGLVKAELAAKDSVIDFRRPRQRPPAVDHSDRYKAFALLAIAVLAAAFFGIRYLLGEQDRKITAMDKQAIEREEHVTKANARLDALSEMELWHGRSVNWLDELTYLSKQLPPPEKVRLNDILCTDRGTLSRFADSPSRGVLAIKGGVDMSQTLPGMNAALRNEQHRVLAGGLTNRPGESEYRVRFEDTLYIATGDATVEPDDAANDVVAESLAGPAATADSTKEEDGVTDDPPAKSPDPAGETDGADDAPANDDPDANKSDAPKRDERLDGEEEEVAVKADTSNELEDVDDPAGKATTTEARS